MKQTAFLALLLFAAAPVAEAAGVRLEHLQDFDRQVHSIAVNVEVEVEGGCLVDQQDLAETFTGLLGVFGLHTSTLQESQLEFAVSVKGLHASAGLPCGIRLLSMARQVPDIKMLRIPPGSTSTRYRLWKTEAIVTAGQDDIQAQLQEQARKDVVAFVRMLD